MSPSSALQVLLHLLSMRAAEDIHLRTKTASFVLLDLTHDSSFVHVAGCIAAQSNLRHAVLAASQV